MISVAMIVSEMHKAYFVSILILTLGVALIFFETFIDRNWRYLVLVVNMCFGFAWVGVFDRHLIPDSVFILINYDKLHTAQHVATFFTFTYLFSYVMLFRNEETFSGFHKSSLAGIVIIVVISLFNSFFNNEILNLLHRIIVIVAPTITIVYSLHARKNPKTKCGHMITLHVFLLFFYMAQNVNSLFLDYSLTISSEAYAIWLFALVLHHVAWVKINFAAIMMSCSEVSSVSVQALEKEVLRRTNDLRIARENAERMAALQRDFLATMSHELRTPLASAIGLCRMLANDEDLPLRVRKDMGTIERLSVHLLRMVDEGLAYVRQRGKDEPVMPKPVNMRCLLRDLESISQWLSQHQGNDFTLLHFKGVPQVLHFDEKRLRQIIINLVSNAGRYCKGGSISLGVRFKMKGGSGVLYWFIHDTGRGMTAQEMDRIFEPFVKSRDSEGLGLGLALVKRLSEEMGGSVNVKSQLGVGTRFSLAIPVFVEEENVEEMQLEQAVSDRRHFSVSRPMTLLTDDEISRLRLSELRSYVRLGQFSEINEWLSIMEKSPDLSVEVSRFLKMIREAVTDIDFGSIEALIDKIDSPLT